LAAAEAALPRAADQESLRQAQHHLHPFAPRHSYALRSRARALPLLRPMRTGLYYPFKFQPQPGAHSPAMQTGRMTLITGAMAREIVVGKDGKVEAVLYIDKATRTEKRVSARAVVV